MILKQVVEQSDTKAGRIFDLTSQFLVFVSIISFAIETVPDLSESTIDLLNLAETIIVILFTIEYLLRIYVSDHKIKFILSVYGIVDLVAILPFYLSLGLDLRSIRIIRFIRLFRILKLARYNQAIQNFYLALKSIKEELILFVIVTFMLLYVSSVGIYYFEHEVQPEAFASIFHCFWWALVSLTTVGYGDSYPITTGGKIFTSFILLIGLGVVAVPVGLITSALTNVRAKSPPAKELK